jgi:hypothetical protein
MLTLQVGELLRLAQRLEVPCQAKCEQNARMLIAALSRAVVKYPRPSQRRSDICTRKT